MDASDPVQGVLLLDFVLIVSVISVAQMPETGSPPLDYHIQTTGRLLQQFDLIIPSSLKKVQPTDSPPVCRLGFIVFFSKIGQELVQKDCFFPKLDTFHKKKAAMEGFYSLHGGYRL